MGQYTYPPTSQPQSYLEVTTIQVTVGSGLQKKHSKESSYSKRHAETLRKHAIKRDRHGKRG